MNSQNILEHLLELLEANNVTVRREPLGGTGGGLCSIKGKRIFFVDHQASTTEIATRAAQAVAKVADIENIYIKPEIREFIEKNRDV
jgi:hypothetical protein